MSDRPASKKDKQMHLEIITPDKLVYSGEVTAVTFPGTEGSFGVLRNHTALISTLKKGKIKITSNSQNTEVEVKGGVVEVLHNKITVLAE
jgi:F-type H+-transporting ATPase subunit epsilon